MVRNFVGTKLKCWNFAEIKLKQPFSVLINSYLYVSLVICRADYHPKFDYHHTIATEGVTCTLPHYHVSEYCRFLKDIDDLRYRIHSAIRHGFPLSRMSINNQISPMQFCCNTSFTLPKQSQRSSSVL